MPVTSLFPVLPRHAFNRRRVPGSHQLRQVLKGGQEYVHRSVHLCMDRVHRLPRPAYLLTGGIHLLPHSGNGGVHLFLHVRDGNVHRLLHPLLVCRQCLCLLVRLFLHDTHRRVGSALRPLYTPCRRRKIPCRRLDPCRNRCQHRQYHRHRRQDRYRHRHDPLHRKSLQPVNVRLRLLRRHPVRQDKHRHRKQYRHGGDQHHRHARPFACLFFFFTHTPLPPSIF